MSTLLLWRHPKPRDVAGRCIGHTDVSVDPRKIKRLAHRIRRVARQQKLPRVVVTSGLQRCALVGRCLTSWGWEHRVDARLSEMNFGTWDGLAWADISVADIDAWCADFGAHEPGGGESVAQVLSRCRAVVNDFSAASEPTCLVAHAGWISALIWLKTQLDVLPTSADWPLAVAYGSEHRFELKSLNPQTRSAADPTRLH